MAYLHVFATLIPIKNYSDTSLYLCCSGVRQLHHVSLLFHSVEVSVCIEVKEKKLLESEFSLVYSSLFDCSSGLHRKGPWPWGESITLMLLILPFCSSAFLFLFVRTGTTAEEPFLFKFCQLAV